MKYKVNRLNSDNINSFKNLLKKYNSKHVFLANSIFFKWQYLNKNTYNGYILSKQKKFSAFQLFIPYSRYDRKLSKNIFLTNFYSLGIHLAAGYIVFKKILKNLSPSFIGSTGVWSKNLINYHKKLGFNTGSMNHFVMPSPFVKKLKILILKNNNIIKNAPVESENIENNYKMINKNNVLNFKYKIKFDYQPVKSINYIINRYLNHPEFNYEVFGWSEKKNFINSIVVFRVIKFKSSSIIKIVEIFGKNKYFPKYKNLFLFYLKRHKSEFISFYNLGVENEFIKKCGFKLIKNEKSIYPELFNPLVKKNIILNYAFICSGSKKNVRLFLGDGDRDRPN